MAQCVPKVPDWVVEDIIKKLCENCKKKGLHLKDPCPDCEYV